MTKLRVNCFSISADGYGAGPDQSLDNPLGVGGMALHSWVTVTRAFAESTGSSGGETGRDDDITRAGFENLGAWILGRNMFAPIRGPWPDDEWKGWWGDNPSYHCPVFVLTHHPRDSIEMEGGTVFHFITDGAEAALDAAKKAANGKDIRLGGGSATIRQYLERKEIDEMHIAVSPVLLGSGEPLFAGLDLPALGYRVDRHETTPRAMHLFFKKA